MRNISKLLAKLLRNLDFEVEEHPVPDATVKAAGMQSVTNIIVRHKFGDGPTIALNAHGDVVPPGSGWQYDPYGAEIVTEGGQRKMFGRGVAVSKSDLAGYTWALLALKEAQSKVENSREQSNFILLTMKKLAEQLVRNGF